jgi:hypothetical protein
VRGVPAVCLLALLAAAGPAQAGVFRCVQADGSIRFAGSPHVCERGATEVQPPGDRLQRVPAPPAAPDESPAAAPGAAPAPSAALDALWLSAAAAGPGWEVVREIPPDPKSDPDLVGWGVRALDTRHYTRHAGGRVEVCSVEIWQFENEARAEAAHAGFHYPDWQIDREGALLVMLRAVTMAPGVAPSRAVFADCRSLGERIRARAHPTPPAGGR